MLCDLCHSHITVNKQAKYIETKGFNMLKVNAYEDQPAKLPGSQSAQLWNKVNTDLTKRNSNLAAS